MHLVTAIAGVKLLPSLGSISEGPSRPCLASTRHIQFVFKMAGHGDAVECSSTLPAREPSAAPARHDQQHRGPALAPSSSNASTESRDSVTGGGEAVVVVTAELAKPHHTPAVAPAGHQRQGNLQTARVPRLYLSHAHPAVVARLAPGSGPAAPAPPLPASRALVLYGLMPLVLPLLVAYFLVCLVLAVASALLVWPSLLLARQLYWACPFIPFIWKGSMRNKAGLLGSFMLRLQFEGAHCVTVIGRLLTLPLRPHLPDFYIAGFPKCGTTSLAAYLKLHPDLSGISGMPGHEALGKESHFLGGILGRGTGAASAALYRSFFPTIITRWWHEAALGSRRWQCFDATPTYACMPHVPARVRALTPDAKVVFMVREPTSAVFSAESMLRGMGVPLTWSLAKPLPSSGGGGDMEAPMLLLAQDDLLQDNLQHAALWSRLAALPPGAPLPLELPSSFYLEPQSYLKGAQYADRLQEWAKHLPPENLLVVDFKRFVATPEVVVKEVLAFVGADISRYQFRRMPPAMATDYHGAKMDPTTRKEVASRWFRRNNATLFAMIGTDLGWGAA